MFAVDRWLPRFAIGCVVLSLALVAEAGKPTATLFDNQFSQLDRDEGRIGGLAKPTRGGHASQHGSTLAVDAGGLWILERNAGALIRADHAGEVRSVLPLHEGLGELVRDPGSGSLFVADRSADRVLRFTTSGDEATLAAELSLVEPHGLALTPDGTTLLVTSVADHELVAVEVATMKVRWRVELPPEPRAVAVSPEGRWALVGFLSSPSLARIELIGVPDGEARKISWHALSPRDPVELDAEFNEDWGGESVSIRTIEAGSRFDVPNDIGRRHARNVFALAFVGEGIAVAAHQVATPQMKLIGEDRDDSYGGGAAEIEPIEYRIARIAEPSPDGLTTLDQHKLDLHQPRALAYDAVRDVLYVGGYGDDQITAIGSASREGPTLLWEASLGFGPACGLDGLAIADPDGPSMQLWAHCELTRSIVRIDMDPESVISRPISARKWVRGPTLAPSLRSSKVERGADLFRRGEDFTLGGALACASCHPEGRSDGLSWKLGKAILQTPILAGRLPDTSPYKWTGEDPTLLASFEHTIERIGGHPEEINRSDLTAIAEYLTSLAKPRPPSVDDPAALERGRVVFESECSVCHVGERSTDRERHEFVTSLAEVDTPSLIGLAHSAPYYHDGSAINLAALLDDRGSIHDMVDSSALSAEQRRDLIVYLQSL